MKKIVIFIGVLFIVFTFLCLISPKSLSANGSVCGDGFCDIVVESPLNCPEDCGDCGDGICEGQETDLSCPADCPAPPSCVPTHSKEKGPRCSDGLDNDCDGLKDLDDPDCL